MKKFISQSNNNPFQKLLIKIIRKLGFEVIDQSNLYLPGKEKFYENNISKINENNTVLPLGRIDITRKVKSLLVIFRSFTKENKQLSVRKKRIFECEKKEYTKRCLNSICSAIELAQSEFTNINFVLKIIDDNSDEKTLKELAKILNNYKIENSIENLDIEKFREKQNFNNNERMIAHNAHLYQSKELAKNLNYDLIYFVEDDYLHLTNSITEMLYSYEKFSTIYKQDVILCPTDYPYLYQQNLKSNILIGNEKYWRTVDQTLCTYLISKDLLINYWESYIEMATNNYDPYEKPLHSIYNERICLSPIPSLSIHLSNLNTVYGLSPLVNWKDIWEKSKVNF